MSIPPSPTTQRSPTRWLRHLPRLLWMLFLLASLLVATFWSSGWGEVEVIEWTQRHLHQPPLETGNPPSALQAAILAVLNCLDPVWIVLAAVNVYLFTIQQEGLSVARRWAGIILGVAWSVGILSMLTGWPMGPIYFTDLLGRKLGSVPLGQPLLWLAVLLGARDLVLRLRPRLGPLALALSTGVLVLLFDLALEPVAWKVRVFWLWYPGLIPSPSTPPFSSYATWFGVAALLAYGLREQLVVHQPQPARRSPAAVFLIILAAVLLGLCGRWARGEFASSSGAAPYFRLRNDRLQLGSSPFMEPLAPHPILFL